MKDSVCPKCGSKDVLSNLLVRGGGDVSPYVEVTEPKPEKRSFIWTPKYEQSTFRAWVCGACGYAMRAIAERLRTAESALAISKKWEEPG